MQLKLVREGLESEKRLRTAEIEDRREGLAD